MSFYLVGQREITPEMTVFNWSCQECGVEATAGDIRYFVKIDNEDTTTVCETCRQTLETK